MGTVLTALRANGDRRTPPTRRPRRTFLGSLHAVGSAPSEAGRSAILKTTNALLYEVGLNQMSIEQIAERSGVAKATIYRWWPSKTMLALDAYLEEMTGRITVPDSDSAEEAFIRQMHAVIEFYRGPEGSVFSQFVAAAQSDQLFAAEFRDRFLAQRRTGVRMIWDRGVKNGEFRDDVDPEVALDMLYGPVIYRLLTGRAELSSSFAEQLIQVAMTGFRAKT